MELDTLTNCPTGYKKLICPNTIAIIEIPFVIYTDNELAAIIQNLK